jgi:hypothetical protein
MNLFRKLASTACNGRAQERKSIQHVFLIDRLPEQDLGLRQA